MSVEQIVLGEEIMDRYDDELFIMSNLQDDIFELESLIVNLRHYGNILCCVSDNVTTVDTKLKSKLIDFVNNLSDPKILVLGSSTEVSIEGIVETVWSVIFAIIEAINDLFLKIATYVFSNTVKEGMKLSERYILNSKDTAETQKIIQHIYNENKDLVLTPGAFNVIFPPFIQYGRTLIESTPEEIVLNMKRGDKSYEKGSVFPDNIRSKVIDSDTKSFKVALNTQAINNAFVSSWYRDNLLKAIPLINNLANVLEVYGMWNKKLHDEVLGIKQSNRYVMDSANSSEPSVNGSINLAHLQKVMVMFSSWFSHGVTLYKRHRQFTIYIAKELYLQRHA